MTISLLEHPLGAQPGQPGDRSAFHFETITRLPSTASGLGRDGARYGRTGIIHTPHGDIRTPAFVPVGTQAAMKAVLPEQMKDLGAQCLLANAFHLFERPGEDVLDAAGVAYEVFDQVPPDSSMDVVNEVARLYAERGCDGFVAIGGGSVIDTTKGAAASLACEGVDFATLQG